MATPSHAPNRKRKPPPPTSWLTEHAVTKLTDSKRSILEDDPTLPKTLALQILSLEAVQATKGYEYVQLVLSDGARTIAGLITDMDLKRLKENSWVHRILHVRQWTVLFQPQATLMITLWTCDDAKIEDVIGNPVSDKATASGVPQPTASTSAMPQQQQQRPSVSPYATSSSSSSSTPFSAPQPAHNPYANGVFMSNVVRDPERLPTYFIRDLNTTMNETWAFFATVTEKTDIKPFTNKQTGRSGGVASVILKDANGDRVKASVFENAFVCVYNKLTVGSTYRFARGSIQPTDMWSKRYNPLIKITFSESTVVRDATEADSPEHAKVDARAQLTFTRISAVIAKPDKDMINVLCVVVACGEVSAFTSKAGRALRKRELVLADSSGQGKTISLTMWGEGADNCPRVVAGDIITVADTAVSDYNQKTLSGGVITRVSPDDEQYAEPVRELTEWWNARQQQGGSAAPLPSLTMNSYGSSAEATPCASIRIVKDRKLGMDTTPDTFTVRGWVSRLSDGVINYTNAPIFKSCPGKKPGDKGKHGTSTTDEGGMYCVTCNETFPGYTIQFLLKCEIKDMSGEGIWVTMFGDVARGFMVGPSGEPLQAATVQALHEHAAEDKSAYDSVLANAIGKGGTFRITGSRQMAEAKYPDFVVKHVEMETMPKPVTGNGLNGEADPGEADMSGTWGIGGFAGYGEDDAGEVMQK